MSTDTLSAVSLTAGDLGKHASFGTGDFGLVEGELIEFGVPDGHPSLWSNPITAIEIKVKTASGVIQCFGRAKNGLRVAFKVTVSEVESENVR